MQNKQNQTLLIDGKTFQNFKAEGVFSVDYLEHLLRNHSVIEQSEEDEDERSIQVNDGLGLKLNVDCEVGSIYMNHNINDLIDNSGNSIAACYGVDELIIDLTSDYLAVHH
ncbi:hypothetical protein [Vibrio sp. 10N.239.312.D08]|uniref:hypothetical protein n=1 Tax=Vibrio sp. 10N.239.312.D08 TaxID=3229978 RepID=UPI00354DFDFE